MDINDLKNILQDLSKMVRISLIDLELKTEAPINLQETLSKIPLAYLKDKSIDFNDKNEIEILTPLMSIKIKDGEQKILIFSDEMSTPKGFIEELEKEEDAFSKYVGIPIKDIQIQKMEIICFTQDNLLSSLLKGNFSTENIEVKDLSLTLSAKDGNTNIAYYGTLKYFGKIFSKGIVPLSYHRAFKTLKKLKLPEYYEIKISGNYEYVEKSIDVFKKLVNLSNISPLLPTSEDIMKLAKKEIKNKEELYYIEKLLSRYKREYEESQFLRKIFFRDILER